MSRRYVSAPCVDCRAVRELATRPRGVRCPACAMRRNRRTGLYRGPRWRRDPVPIPAELAPLSAAELGL